MSEKKYLLFFKQKAEKLVSDFLCKKSFSLDIIDTSKLSECLYDRLYLICKNSLDIFFVMKVVSLGLFDKYLEDVNSNEIKKIEEEFYLELLEKEETVLKSVNKKLFEAMEESIKLFFEFIEEFLDRFSKDIKEIEDTLFDGIIIKQIISLSPGMGDCHNHGRTTMIVSTDAGKFVYKPHDVYIDLWTKQFFDNFFCDVSLLPKVLCKNNYGYCQFVENTPATSKEGASKYYEKLGSFCSIVTIMSSRDLHVENLLSNGICPIPVDLEMMFCPVKQEKTEFYTNLEKTIITTGLLPFRIGGKLESSLLFSEDEINMSAPIIDGHKVNVLGYQKEFLKGFEDGYLLFLKQKNEIVEFVKQMPNFPVRFLVRGTNSYMKLIKKVFTYQWLKDNNLTEEVKKALVIGFEKIGNAKPEMIDSETKAILQANIPYFYSKSNSRNLFDYDGIIKENFFDKSCKKNLLECIEQSSLTDLSLEKKIIQISFERFLKETCKTESTCYDCSQQADYIEEAELLFEKILERKIELPDGSFFWFVTEHDKFASMSLIKDGFVEGLTGMAVFFASLSVCTTNDKLKEKSKELALKIVEQTISKLRILNENEKIFENQLNLSFASGIAGMLHANELIDYYLHSPICEEFRFLLISLLPKLDTSYTNIDLFLGYAGIIKVLCKYDNLYSYEGVPALVSSYCDILLKKRVPLYEGVLLWDCFNNNMALSGAAHGQVGIASALLLAGQKLGRSDLLDAASNAFEYEDKIFSEKLGTWPDFRFTTEPTKFMHGFCSGAPGVGFEMMSYNTDLGRRNVQRAVKVCFSKDFVAKDTVCCGNCAVVDFLLSAGLVSEGQKRMNGVIANGRKNNYSLMPGYSQIFEVNLFYGVSGIGYECLRCANPNMILPLYI